MVEAMVIRALYPLQGCCFVLQFEWANPPRLSEHLMDRYPALAILAA
jgi:hypothetical protein